MNKKDLEELADIRIREAKALLDAQLSNGAYYLAGYALECAIKACIAKKIQQHDFPDKKLAEDSYSHNLSKLIGVAGLKQALEIQERSSVNFSINWALAKDWSEQARYDAEVDQTKASNLCNAITDTQDGVLPWLKTYW